jgi:hypothetical protein
VLGDHVVEGIRTITLVVERDGRCVSPSALEVAPPFAGKPRTACVVELVGPALVMPTVRVGGDVLPATWNAAATTVAPDLVPPPDPGRTLKLVPVPARLPVGREVIAAYLIAVVDGQPTSDVELNVSADGAVPRALRWQRPGVAEIVLVVPKWRPKIEIVARRGDDIAARTTVAVDPGAPIDVRLPIPAIEAAAPFSVAARVATEGGADVAPERVRVRAPGCSELRPATFSCAVAAPIELIVDVAIADDWVPVAVERADVAPREPAAADHHTLWSVGIRGGVGTARSWLGGPVASMELPWRPHVSWEARAGALVEHATFPGVAPVTANLSLTEVQLEAQPGARVEFEGGVPWSLRVAAGPAYVYQHGSLGGKISSSSGLRGAALVTMGVRASIARVAFDFDVGARFGINVIAPGWARSLSELILEVSVVRGN